MKLQIPSSKLQRSIKHQMYERLINTGLQPGEYHRERFSAASAAFPFRGKPAKQLASSPFFSTVPKPGANEKRELDVGAWNFSGAWMLVLGAFLSISGVSCAATADTAPAKFAAEQNPDHLVITHSGLSIAHYVFSDTNILRPYLAHVHTLDGVQVTRNHPPVAGQDAVDHPTMHPGIWLAFGDISGQDFWRNKASIRHERFIEPPTTRNDKLTFATESTLVSSNATELAKLNSRFTFHEVPDGYWVVWDAAFTPTADNFTFGDQEEMGFGIRVATPIAEKNGGTIQNSDGMKGARTAWGKTAAWCDYSGIISNRLVGITVLASPKNFRPSWFHSRDYGLVVANPFGQKAFTKGDASAIPVKKGETFHIRFAAFIHSTPTNETPDLGEAYKQFIQTESPIQTKP